MCAYGCTILKCWFSFYVVWSNGQSEINLVKITCKHVTFYI